MAKNDLFQIFAATDPDAEGQLALFELDEIVPITIIQKEWQKDCKYRLIDDLTDLKDVLTSIPEGVPVAFDTETTSLDVDIAEIVGFSFAWQIGEAYYVPVRHTRGKEHNVDPEEALALMDEHVFQKHKVIAHNTKYDNKIVYRAIGHFIPDIEDTMILCNLADTANPVGLKVVAKRYLGIDMVEIDELFEALKPKKGGKKVPIKFQWVHPLEAVPYACPDADAVLRLYYHLAHIREEMPFIWRLDNQMTNVIMDIESNRFRVNVDYFQRLQGDVNQKIEAVTQQIWEAAGERFDVGSPKVLGKILFEKLNLPVISVTEKSGQYQTDDNVLEQLKDRHKIIPLIQQHRSLIKLRGTYIEPFFGNLDEQGCGRFVLRNAATPTGRLAGGGKPKEGGSDGSVPMNIQAIPNCAGSLFFRARRVLTAETVKPFMAGDPTYKVPDISLYRGDTKKYEKAKGVPTWSEGLINWVGQTYCVAKSCEGCAHPCKWEWDMVDLAPDPNIRIGFIAREGYTIFSVDWSGVELRIAANLSGERVWIDAFLEGKDLHMEMTKRVLGKLEPTKEERNDIKSLNFGLLYGAGPNNVAEQTGKSFDEAKVLYDDYWASVPALGKWKSHTLYHARKNGYAETYFKRKRHLNTKPGEDYNISIYDPESKDDKWKIRKAMADGDRKALNHGVQGCLHRDTRVITNRGYLRIGDLYDGKVTAETVWDGEGWRTFDVLNRGPARRVDVELCDGRVIRCDDRHEFFIPSTIKSGMTIRKVQDLQTVTCPKLIAPRRGNPIEFEREFEPFHYEGNSHNAKSVSITTPDELEQAWYWAGYIMGDGNLMNKGVAIAFGYHDFKYQKSRKFISWVESLGLNYTERDNPGAIGRSFQICVHTLGLMRMFEWLGLVEGATSKTKRLPERLFSETVRNRMAFLQGMWDSDGSKTGNSPGALHLMNRDLLADIQLLYDTVGKNGHLSKTYKDGSAQLTLRKGRGHHKNFSDKFDYVRVRDVRYLDEVEDTFTLAVHHDNHRFFSDGVLSKNTSADLMRIAACKIRKEINLRGWHDKIHLLTTVHDELDFEVRNDAIEEVIPVIVQCMLISVPGWVVPLAVDVECANSWGAVYAYDQYMEDNKGLLRVMKDDSETALLLPIPEVFDARVLRKLLQQHPGNRRLVLLSPSGKRVEVPQTVNNDLPKHWPWGA